MKKVVILAFLLCNLNFIFATTAKYKCEDYTLNVTYNDTISPGDAVFARLTLVLSKGHKKTKTDFERKATLQLLQDKKLLETSAFYVLPKTKKQNSVEMLGSIPVSLWLEQGNYTLKLIFANSDSDVKEFILPSSFKSKDFNKETIELDFQNTAIKTNNTPERASQIDKLNTILFTTTSDIYNLKKFIPPTDSQRYTAYCGDRRIYAYSNGKTSSSLHYGNDYGVPTGTEVKACGDGKVVMAENRISSGYSIVIEHLPGLYSLYYHLNEMNVKEGDFVKQGELIGKSGSTGLTTGPHLHWEIRLNGSAVCPEFFLNDFTYEND